MSLDGPVACVSLLTSTCIESPGGTQGPPLLDQPEELCMPSFRSRRAASLAANFVSSNHSGLM